MLPAFIKQSIADVQQGFEYASGTLKFDKNMSVSVSLSRITSTVKPLYGVTQKWSFWTGGHLKKLLVHVKSCY